MEPGADRRHHEPRLRPGSGIRWRALPAQGLAGAGGHGRGEEAVEGTGTGGEVVVPVRGAARREDVPLFHRRQVERGVDQRGGALEVVVTVDILLHDRRRTAVELLVLLMTAAELGAKEIP